ncbi:MAG: hypothetical protein JNN22_14580 [Rhodospirillales bacterium]|nr:hypothetical protein [Rhodospirillales bacterium]
MDAQSVRPGQRFVSHELYAWIVDEILHDGYSVPHARLRALYDPEIVRIIACPVLLNPARFKSAEA